MIELLKNTDTRLFLFLNGKHNDFFDVLMWWASYKFTWVPLYGFFLFFIWKKYGKKSFLLLISILIMVLISDQISVQVFKNVFMRYRPCYNENIKQLVHLVDGYCGGQYGFISSHAANTFALAVFLSFVFQKKYFSVLVIFWAILNSYSRVYLGVHYPSDVVFGALLGCIVGYIVFRLFIIAEQKLQF